MQKGGRERVKGEQNRWGIEKYTISQRLVKYKVNDWGDWEIYPQNSCNWGNNGNKRQEKITNYTDSSVVSRIRLNWEKITGDKLLTKTLRPSELYMMMYISLGSCDVASSKETVCWDFWMGNYLNNYDEVLEDGGS